MSDQDERLSVVNEITYLQDSCDQEKSRRQYDMLDYAQFIAAAGYPLESVQAIVNAVQDELSRSA